MKRPVLLSHTSPTRGLAFESSGINVACACAGGERVESQHNCYQNTGVLL